MKKILLISLLSLSFSQELKVEGNLNVTGAVINDSLAKVIAAQQAEIDALQSLIASLQSQIDALQNGNEIVTGTVTDIDGNVYQTVVIGNQNWMAENLKVTHYRNGDAISNAEPDLWWQQFVGTYIEHPEDYNLYGNFYNWYAAIDERGVCPEGWHVPTRDEWIVLSNFLGGAGNSGGHLKIVGFEYWNSPNDGATNSTGFSALPAGMITGGSWELNQSNFRAYFISTTEQNSTFIYARMLDYNNYAFAEYNLWHTEGYSIRCIQD